MIKINNNLSVSEEKLVKQEASEEEIIDVLNTMIRNSGNILIRLESLETNDINYEDMMEYAICNLNSAINLLKKIDPKLYYFNLSIYNYYLAGNKQLK